MFCARSDRQCGMILKNLECEENVDTHNTERGYKMQKIITGEITADEAVAEVIRKHFNNK